MSIAYIGDVSTGRHNNFNLIRIIAAIGVLLSHAYPLSWGISAIEPLHTLLHGLALGKVCVVIFFAVSGFFIARSFDNRQSLWLFVQARALRIFPSLAMVLVVTILVGSMLTSSHLLGYWQAAPEYFLRNFTLFALKFDLPGVFEANPYPNVINGPLWTLRFEVVCYFGVVACGMLGLLRKPMLFAVAASGFFLVYAMVMNFNNLPGQTLFSLALPFTVGMSFWVWRDIIPLSVGLVIASAIVAAMTWFTSLFVVTFTLSLSYAVFVLGYAHVPWALRYNRLGDYSYGTYVYAWPIQQLVASLGVTSPFWNMAMAIPLTLLCAILSWHFVEAPALRWKRTKLTLSGPACTQAA